MVENPYRDEIIKILDELQMKLKAKELTENVKEALRTHGFFKLRQGMLTNENYLKWR